MPTSKDSITIRLGESLRSAIERVSEKNGLSPSTLIRAAVYDTLAALAVDERLEIHIGRTIDLAAPDDLAALLDAADREQVTG
jgi:hypothetical protein